MNTEEQKAIALLREITQMQSEPVSAVLVEAQYLDCSEGNSAAADALVMLNDARRSARSRRDA